MRCMVLVKGLPGDAAVFHQLGDSDVVQPLGPEQLRQGGHDLVFGRLWHIASSFLRFWNIIPGFAKRSKKPGLTVLLICQGIIFCSGGRLSLGVNVMKQKKSKTLWYALAGAAAGVVNGFFGGGGGQEIGRAHV